MAPSKNIRQFKSLVRNSKNIVAIAGAGLSAASGIPTFRDAGGLWRSYDAMSLANPEAFAANPSRVWQFYHMRREKARKATPNAAHMALAALSSPEQLAAIAPSAKFTLITQNVDGLSLRALKAVHQSEHIPEAVSVFEMHGRLFETLCTKCGDREANFDSPICPALARTEEIMERHEKEPEIPLEQLPQCKKCAGLLRPGVVWFEEIPYHMSEIQEIVDNADLGLVIGTSSTVYPAAGYAYDIMDHGGKVAVFNLQKSEGDDDTDFLFLGPCEETLPHILLGANK